MLWSNARSSLVPKVHFNTSFSNCVARWEEATNATLVKFSGGRGRLGQIIIWWSIEFLPFIKDQTINTCTVQSIVFARRPLPTIYRACPSFINSRKFVGILMGVAWSRIALFTCQDPTNVKTMAGRMDTNSTLSSVAPYSSRVSVSIPYVRHKFDIQVLDQVIFANVYVSIFFGIRTN